MSYVPIDYSLGSSSNENYYYSMFNNDCSDNIFLPVVNTLEHANSTSDETDDKNQEHQSNCLLMEIIVDHRDNVKAEEENNENCSETPNCSQTPNSYENNLPYKTPNYSDTQNCSDTYSTSEINVIQKFDRVDGFQKKFKTHLMKFILKIINNYLKRLGIGKPKMRKLPNKEFNSNVKIDFNKSLLPKTLFKIYSKRWGNSKRDLELFEINSSILHKINETNDNSILTNFLSKTFEEVIKDYLDSKEFQKDKKKIEQKQCLDVCEEDCDERCKKRLYVQTFEKIARGFSEYFKNSNGNKKSKKEPVEIKKEFNIFKVRKQS